MERNHEVLRPSKTTTIVTYNSRCSCGAVWHLFRAEKHLSPKNENKDKVDRPYRSVGTRVCDTPVREQGIPKNCPCQRDFCASRHAKQREALILAVSSYVVYHENARLVMCQTHRAAVVCLSTPEQV